MIWTSPGLRVGSNFWGYLIHVPLSTCSFLPEHIPGSCLDSLSEAKQGGFCSHSRLGQKELLNSVCFWDKIILILPYNTRPTYILDIRCHCNWLRLPFKYCYSQGLFRIADLWVKKKKCLGPFISHIAFVFVAEAILAVSSCWWLGFAHVVWQSVL